MAESIVLMGWHKVSVYKSEIIENTSLAFHKLDVLWVTKEMQRTSSQLAVMLSLSLTLCV